MGELINQLDLTYQVKWYYNRRDLFFNVEFESRFSHARYWYYSYEDNSVMFHMSLYKDNYNG